MLSGGVPAVEHVGDIPPFQALAELRTLAVAQGMIQDDSRRRVVFNDSECLGKGPHCHYSRAGVGEGVCDVECDQGRS